MAIKNKKRGFALLIAVVFMSVMLAIGLAISSLSYKQQVLASYSIQSQYAFYVADAGLECALYADQGGDVSLFSYPIPPTIPTTAPVMSCDGNPAISAEIISDTENQWVITERLRLDSNKRCADITIYKLKPNAPVTDNSYIYSQGYNVSCDTVANPNGARFVMRGLYVRF